LFSSAEMRPSGPLIIWTLQMLTGLRAMKSNNFRFEEKRFLPVFAARRDSGEWPTRPHLLQTLEV